MDTRLISGSMFALGGFAFCAWGIFDAWGYTRNTPNKEYFDWVKAMKTIVPTVVGAFIAGYNATPSSAIDYVTLVLGGYGFAVALRKGEKLVVGDFFREDK